MTKIKVNTIYLTTDNEHARIIGYNKNTVFCYSAHIYATLSDALLQQTGTVLRHQYYSESGGPLDHHRGRLMLSCCTDASKPIERVKLKLTF